MLVQIDQTEDVTIFSVPNPSYIRSGQEQEWFDSHNKLLLAYLTNMGLSPVFSKNARYPDGFYTVLNRSKS